MEGLEISFFSNEKKKWFGRNIWDRNCYVPVYMLLKGKEYFVCNNSKGIEEETAEKTLQLFNNKGKFLMFYCHCKANTPLEFIKFVKEGKYTFQIHGELFQAGGSFIDFHGNLIELSCAFHFRIYDKALIKKVKQQVRNMKKKFHYKRKKIA